MLFYTSTAQSAQQASDSNLWTGHVAPVTQLPNLLPLLAHQRWQKRSGHSDTLTLAMLARRQEGLCRQIPMCRVAPAQSWHRFGLGRPARWLEQRQRASEVNPAQSSLCKATSLLPKHPDADLGGVDVRRRRCEEECKCEPAAISCSRKGPLAQAVVMAAPVISSPHPNCSLSPHLAASVDSYLGEHHVPGWLPSITAREQCQRG